MSIEQVESAILALTLEQRRRLLIWFEENRDALFSPTKEADELGREQQTEVLRRRQEYADHPELFIRMDEKSLDEMFARIRGHVAARLSSPS